MKKIAFMLISLYMGLMGASAQSNKYDLNEDGHVNITDVTKLVTNILDQNNINGYDLNNDGDVNITDVILMVNHILGDDNGNTNDGGNSGGIGDTSQAYLTCPDDNHPHMIDLGLPSGTKWACCNVGASSPEEYGGYYAWGETEEKTAYYGENYIYDYNDILIDLGSDISGTENDVAHVKWGGNWRMPTSKECWELRNCTIESTTLNGVSGYKVTGKFNGNSIFLPAAGWRWDGETYIGPGDGSFFWSSSIDKDPLDWPYYSTPSSYCWIQSSGIDDSAGVYCGWEYFDQAFGLSVRPVWKE